jgi:hypothetical protein
MKKLSLIAVLAVSAVFAMAQYFPGTPAKAFNVIPNNEGTPIIVNLQGTNVVTNATTRALTTPSNAIEIPAGRDVGILVQGTIITNNANPTLNYQLSPDNANWTWPPLTIATGVISSNTTPTFKVPITLSNSVTYPFRYLRFYSVTAGTNSIYVSNAIVVYKSNPQANNYSR